MLKLSLDKSVTAIEEPINNIGQIVSMKYRDLPQYLKGVNEMVVEYPYGMLKTRVKTLESLGFMLHTNIWFEPIAVHSTIRQVWVRSGTKPVK
ncbi:hypothetical protein D3C71_1294040 [compost metagenome]